MACNARHPAAPLAIRTVVTIEIGTLLTQPVRMSSHIVHHNTMCSSCSVVYLLLNKLLCNFAVLQLFVTGLELCTL